MTLRTRLNRLNRKRGASTFTLQPMVSTLSPEDARARLATYRYGAKA